MAIEPLGIDNVIFEVADLEMSISFYLRCGFRLRWRSDDKAIALFAIGPETPGLLLRRGAGRGCTGCLWVEVGDATITAEALESVGLRTMRIESATGLTCEVRDPTGNRIGFADYSRKPELGRARS